VCPKHISDAICVPFAKPLAHIIWLAVVDSVPVRHGERYADAYPSRNPHWIWISNIEL